MSLPLSDDVKRFMRGVTAARTSRRRHRAVCTSARPIARASDIDSTPSVLDEASRALVVRLHNGVPRELRATGKQLDAMIARLEQRRATRVAALVGCDRKVGDGTARHGAGYRR
jgi:hypothetical protein